MRGKEAHALRNSEKEGQVEEEKAPMEQGSSDPRGRK